MTTHYYFNGKRLPFLPHHAEQAQTTLPLTKEQAERFIREWNEICREIKAAPSYSLTAEHPNRQLENVRY